MPMHQRVYRKQLSKRDNKKQDIYIKHIFCIFGIKQKINNFGTDAPSYM